MPHSARLRKVGGSVMLAIPKPVLEALELGPDAAVALSVKSGRLVVDPARRKRYSLDQLLAQCRPSGKRSRQNREWVSGRAVGRELI